MTAPTLTVERTHLLRNDLDWLPGWLKAIRWTVAGTVWTGLFGGFVGLMFASHMHVFIFGKGLSALALGGFYAGDKAARSVLRRRLSRLAHGDVDLNRLKQEADGELVHVVGKVRAREKLAEGDCVYRRVVFAVGDARVVHEKAVDFALVDDSGETVLVHSTGARLIALEPKLVALSDDKAWQFLGALQLPQGAQKAVTDWSARRNKGKRVQPVRAGEVLLRDGDKVEVVGYKSRSVDSSVVDRLVRDTPLRATVRGGKELPLLLSPA